MVNMRQALDLGMGSIKHAKLRSALTTLGIIIGVAAVVANVSLGASFNQFFTDELGTLGSNFIIIYSQDVNILHENELNIVRNTPGVEGVSPSNGQMAAVTYLSSKRQIDVQGVSQDAENILNIQLEEGNFFTDKDKYVAVLGWKVANEKFDRNISINNYIDITFTRDDGSTVAQKFKVKGIISSPENTFVQGGPDRDITIYIPIATMNGLLNVSDYGGITAKTGSAESVSTVSDEVDRRLARALGVSARDIENDDVKPYRIFNQAEIIEQLDQLANTLTILITLVALVALVVGSIGIMNIMLVTVTERTREIGLMKSLGFKKNDILLLFMIESTLLGTIGGVLGVLFGAVASYAVQSYLSIPHVFPPYLILLGFSIAFVVGLVAGVYPANKAASMNPVEALRHE
ncbi:MAG: macrolide transporter ATP-binding /permease protein [Methanomethylovorans sp. PtaU1.Bin093]|uniref:ABC transporter permease n=1 Tax=Methanomethylovorans sp. PtaU1.Bin093 TaxID=1811679 RepID=UPI0009C4853A|nr:ABC transporter permease [Methanomethylovorans sp. PtaU1.Bin093]OPY21974.1 MAG: macrolide transporter ATP-binding /permease protein [Methanomethylovorans sp. PtaU1.Bin093]